MNLELKIDGDGKVATLTVDGPCHMSDIATIFERLIELDAAPDLMVMADVDGARLTGSSFAAVSEVDDAFDRFSAAYPVGTQVLMVNGRSSGTVPAMFARLARERGYGLRIFVDRGGVLAECDDIA